jgi:hypothetical protein
MPERAAAVITPDSKVGKLLERWPALEAEEVVRTYFRRGAAH